MSAQETVLEQLETMLETMKKMGMSESEINKMRRKGMSQISDKYIQKLTGAVAKVLSSEKLNDLKENLEGQRLDLKITFNSEGSEEGFEIVSKISTPRARTSGGSKGIVLDGTWYPSSAAAARDLKVTPSLPMPAA